MHAIDERPVLIQPPRTAGGINVHFAIIAASMVAIYSLLAAFSFHDIIYVAELINPASASLIEKGQLTSSPSREAFLLIVASALLCLYVEGFNAIKARGISKTTFGITAAAVAIAAFAVAPFDSTDVSVYINCGWQQSHYGLNPYGVAVGEIANWFADPMFKEHWQKVPSAYGPLFALLASGITAVGSGKYLLTVYLFKAACAICHGFDIFLVSILAHRFQSSEHATLSTYLYAFSPLVLLQGLANGHNDMIAATLACASVWLIFTRGWWLAVAAVLASVATKYGSVALIPSVVSLVASRAGVKNAVLSSLVAGAAAFALFCAYFAPIDDQHFIAIFANLGSYASSVRALISLFQIPGLDSLATIAIFLGCMLTAALRMRAWRTARDSVATRVTDGVLFMALLVCLISTRCQAWYPMMLFPLAVALPVESKMRKFSLYLTALLTFSIMWFGLPGTYMLPLFLALALIGTRSTGS